MNRSRKLYSLIEKVTTHVANIHPEHVAALEKRLKHKKVKYTKTKTRSNIIGVPYC